MFTSRWKRKLTWGASALSLLFTLAAPLQVSAASNYTYYRIGSTTDVTTTTTFGQVLMGGSTDVDEAMRWMINKANGGDFLVIRATGTDAYNTYIRDLGTAMGKPLNSVSTLIVTNLTAGSSDAAVLDKINKAEAIFFAGGNQADYAKLLNGTPMQTALNNRIAQGIPFGGTSAGEMIGSQFVFDAIAAGTKTVTSSIALTNPYNRIISLSRNLVTTPVNQGFLADSHFEQRDRIGRLLSFIARTVKDGWTSQAKGIGVNEQSALLIEANGAVQLVSQPGAPDPAAYFLKGNAAPEICVSGSPLTFTNVSAYKITPGKTFNLSTWSGSGGLSYTLNVNTGTVTSSTGNIYGN
ncbi:cyanophycinase [Paenibacillus roseipurpureus]|uniref:Cyanophycinase n=1 Tax=Paenibacillus roseopurpureus TaxID=2918901 RepID=A0AA96RHU4_9BACL|nr:cyanophycinase [Paenibacillus sp. MBLB1832]WNR42095.1 cyanophycinase [Paenibacillus sp. MBLB1832]